MDGLLDLPRRGSRIDFMGVLGMGTGTGGSGEERGDGVERGNVGERQLN